MAHIDRQPSDKVFKDIQSAAMNVWFNGDFHESYLKEKIDKIESISNYADNWYTFLGMLDTKNQMIFWHFIKLKDTIEFLNEYKKYYNYFVAKDKI